MGASRQAQEAAEADLQKQTLDRNLVARASDDARVASEGEVRRLQEEIVRQQKSYEGEFAQLRSETERLRSELADSQNKVPLVAAQKETNLANVQTVRDELALVREQHQLTKAKLAEASEAQTAANDAVTFLTQQLSQLRSAAPAGESREVLQYQKMLDNALRLQTRAEIALKQAEEELTHETAERHKVEAMMQQLFSKLNQLQDPGQHPSATVFSSRRSSNRTSAKVL